jgi:hypothetical protein
VSCRRCDDGGKRNAKSVLQRLNVSSELLHEHYVTAA